MARIFDGFFFFLHTAPFDFVGLWDHIEENIIYNGQSERINDKKKYAKKVIIIEMHVYMY